MTLLECVNVCVCVCVRVCACVTKRQKERKKSIFVLEEGRKTVKRRRRRGNGFICGMRERGKEGGKKRQGQVIG